jgi:hypothetical protein
MITTSIVLESPYKIHKKLVNIFPKYNAVLAKLNKRLIKTKTVNKFKQTFI